MENYEPFFDQEQPSEPVKLMLGSEDRVGDDYGVCATGVFLTTQNNVLVVEISGNSGWPSTEYGETKQTLFSNNCFYGIISGQLADKVRAKIMELKGKKS